jgi:hypothetical protein
VLVGSEPVHQPEPPQDDQAVLGGIGAGEGELGELSGGEDPVLPQQLAQPPVAVGEAPGQGGQPVGGAPATGGRGHRHHLQPG